MSMENLGKEYFISRELSWLEFNARVLDEAGDKENPLLERLKFISIFSNNLDEFFMVRIAGLRRLLEAGFTGRDPAGLTVKQQVQLLRKRLLGLIRRQHKYLREDILPGLEAAGISIITYDELTGTMKSEADYIFESQIMPVLTPLAVDPSHPFPILNSGAIEIAVKLKTYDSKKTVYAFVEVPEGLPRFIRLTSTDKDTFIMLEDLIMGNLKHLFSGCAIMDKVPFRITRDMDFSLDEEGVSDLLQHIKKELTQRKSRQPIRLQIPVNSRGKLVEWVQKQFKIDDDFKYSTPGPLHLSRYAELIGSLDRPDLLDEPHPPLPHPLINDEKPVFKSIKKHSNIFYCVPFQSFDPVVKMIEEAAEDPDVLAIKQTLYRVSGNSPVVKALQKAAENGKQVTVIVELKARFDEGNNILWARRLEESGAHVVYGIAGLKIHCKALLIIRNTKGIIERYCHLGTGNYNDKTAKIYTDVGLFTNQEELCSDTAALFNVMTGYSAPMSKWAKIAAAPFDMRHKFIALIDRETRLSTPQNPGRIIAKMNSLVDPEIITHLYAAALAGVKIDLIIRGICCLNPGVGTRNIRVISIVDRYLEHSRIYYFANGGEEEYYCSSADWMPRNLDRRVEILFPVEDNSSRQIIQDILNFQLNDRRKGRNLSSKGIYSRTIARRDGASRSQDLTYEYFRKKYADAKEETQELKIFRKSPNL
ncbi:MAG: polyphosphate kinase 1 [Victivallales bacterium]|nr:polyphosphate kinase 1 [Victivallales bacterium]